LKDVLPEKIENKCCVARMLISRLLFLIFLGFTQLTFFVILFNVFLTKVLFLFWIQ